MSFLHQMFHSTARLAFFRTPDVKSHILYFSRRFMFWTIRFMFLPVQGLSRLLDCNQCMRDQIWTWEISQNSYNLSVGFAVVLSPLLNQHVA